MAIEIKMPRLSDTMEAGTLVKWYVKEGEQVESGQVLADIETDKATMEMPTYDAGKVAKIMLKAGANVAVGETVLILAEEGETVEAAIKSVGTGSSPTSEAKSEASAADSSKEPESSPTTTTATASATPTSNVASSSNGTTGRMLISPLARRIAEENGLDLKLITGSGPQGRIIKRDVLAALGQDEEPEQASTNPPLSTLSQMVASPSTHLGDKIALSNMRQTIAKRLVESKNTIPHYQVSVSVNADLLLDLRSTLNEQLASQNVKLSVNDFLVRACALAIHLHPSFNAAWKGDSLQIGEHVNIGVAVALPEERGGGLVVATLRDADRKGLRQISAETKALAEKARGKGLSLEEMSDSTFTISNLGMYEVDFFTAIINPPNAAILAVGAAMKKPVVRNDELTIGHEMSCTLSCDHRIIDGASGARFLSTLKGMLENPATLLV